MAALAAWQVRTSSRQVGGSPAQLREGGAAHRSVSKGILESIICAGIDGTEADVRQGLNGGQGVRVFVAQFAAEGSL